MTSTRILVIFSFSLCGLWFHPTYAGEPLSIQFPLTDETIAAALAQGNDRSEKLVSLSLGSPGANWSGAQSDTNRTGNFFEISQSRRSRSSGFGVELFTPSAWIAKTARSYAEKGREMLARHVDAQLREPVLRVVCYTDLPEQPQPGVYGNPVESVTLRPANRKLEESISPVHVMRVPDRFLTPDGESIDVGPLLASFDLDDVRAISALDKKGEFYVSIVAADGEDKDFKVKSKHFESLP